VKHEKSSAVFCSMSKGQRLWSPRLHRGQFSDSRSTPSMTRVSIDPLVRSNRRPS
jgi:hypothetical protein